MLDEFLRQFCEYRVTRTYEFRTTLALIHDRSLSSQRSGTTSVSERCVHTLLSFPCHGVTRTRSRRSRFESTNCT